MKVEIEIASSLGRALFFLPLNRTLRGRLDLNAIRQARDLADKFPSPLPGLVLGLDTDNGSAWLRDPLYDAEHASSRDALSKMGFGFGPAREEFQSVDLPTWAYWLRQAVAGGHARVISGEVPNVEGLVRKTVLRSAKPEKDQQIDRLLATVDKLTTTIGDLLKLPESKRKQLADAI
jgi:hypothetical protein